jgi:hypothetical protein
VTLATLSQVFFRESRTHTGTTARSGVKGFLRPSGLPRLARLSAVPELVEVDLNPVRCLPDGALVLDMRLRVERRAQAESVTRW